MFYKTNIIRQKSLYITSTPNLYVMLTSIEIPKYLDVLLILDEKVTKAKIYKILDRSTTYLTDALRYFEERGLVKLYTSPKDDRQLMIELTDKGKDVQKIIITLYNVMGLNKTRR